MRKFPIAFIFLTVSFLVISCFNFALPERINIKAEINPSVPLNSESVNLGRKIQDELGELFAGDSEDTSGVKVFNYAPTTDTDSPQKFLISFPMKDQTLDFEEYMAKDIGINENLESINQKFKLDTPDSGDTKIAIDMRSTIGEILSGISHPPVEVNFYTYQINIPLAGFTSLSFHSGYLEITFGIPEGQNYTVSLYNLRVNNRISSEASVYDLNPWQRTVTVSFPLNGETLTNSLSLSYYSPSYLPGNTMSVQTRIRNGAIINKAVGARFSLINDASLPNAPMDLNMSSELIQAEIGAGSVAFTTSALKGIRLSFGSDTKLIQEPNPDAPTDYDGKNLQTGLDAVLVAGGVTNLQGKLLNSKAVKVAGTYSMEVSDPNASEITFNQNGELEIPIDFSLESFSSVYIDSRVIIDNFNKSGGNIVKESLGSLGDTVSELTYEKAGIEFAFGKKVIEGLNLTVGSPTFFLHGPQTKSIKQDTKQEYYEEYNPYRTLVPTPDTEIEFSLNISAAESSNILMLENVNAGEEVTVLECTAKFIFQWKTATLQGGDNTVVEGDFPADGGASFSLGGDSGFTSILKDLKFSDIKGYLFFIGPDLGQTDIRLDLTSYPDSENKIKISDNAKIEVRQDELIWPENNEPYTDDIATKSPSMDNPMDFTETFNRMLPSKDSPDGESLHMRYKMDFGSGGFTISNDDNLSVKVFKTILVIVIPLELEAQDNDARLNLSDQLEGMIGENLLSFTEQDEDDSMKISVDPMTLNIELTGTPLGENSKIIIETWGDPVEIGMKNNHRISFPIADHLDDFGEFVPRKIELLIAKGESLKITQGLSILKFGLNVGVDVTLDL
jgi:hypothetical protein